MLWPAPEEINGSCSLPGIYRFKIEGEGTYVGRYTHSSRVLREYVRNVEKLLQGRPYRPKNPNGFRHVHLALHRAVQARKAICLEIVENVELEMLNERERYWIEQIPLNERLNGKKRPL